MKTNRAVKQKKRSKKLRSNPGGPRGKYRCVENIVDHPDHSKFLPRLNRAKGQIDGISQMIGDRRYCVDILVQFRAVMAALRNIEVSIFESHLEHCVKSALHSKNRSQVNGKIRELTELLSRRTSL